MICYIFLAEGFEDMEALGTRDVLLRGGVDVLTVSINDDLMVTSSHGLTVCADMDWDEFSEAQKPAKDDVLIFPGGMPGSKYLAGHKELMEIMKAHWNAGGRVAAICAAPGLVLSQLDGLSGKRFTCFDGFEDAMIAKGAVYTPVPAVTDGAMTTGRGAGCAIDFALEILTSIKDVDAAKKVRHGLML